ncbi:hypothetical protein BD779DRAFT_122518 [Infundibulicybe gibba]|nr:hypothetical protein BD779DRAFT_122518 [Infundibulicybe gibba]
MFCITIPISRRIPFATQKLIKLPISMQSHWHDGHSGANGSAYYCLCYGDSAWYPSYLTLKLQESEVGRVLRFDSLSKILSAGIVSVIHHLKDMLNAICAKDVETIMNVTVQANPPSFYQTG